MKREVIEGKIQGNERGYAFLMPTDTTKCDYFIPHSDLRGACHGDIVLAETTDGKGERTTARVLKVLERGINKIVGTYFSRRTGGFVIPDDKKYYNDIFVPFGQGVHAKSGDKVVAKILTYPKKGNPEGIITTILGRQFDKKTEIKSIMMTYDLPFCFSVSVLENAKNVCKKVSGKDLTGRKDFRNLFTFTIDGDDARDFDDAVSVSKLKNGNYYLGVHIADVSNYVLDNSPLDKEAFSRGNSVYFPENVIPMLPELLCNGICSLNEGEDRLTLSCMMEVDKNGEVVDREIVESVINSKKRLTYTIAQKMLDGDKKSIDDNKEVYKNLVLMDKLCDILMQKREKKGSIDLDVKESEIYVDNKGRIEVTPSIQNKAQKIIEEFMILANVTVSEYFYYLDLPFVYRIHEKPEEERLENFYKFLDQLGVKYKRKKDEVYSKDFQTILKSVENSKNYTLINRVMLRSMQKAKYSEECCGHFGLSEDKYCHFTSPIRRYSDLAIHRIIKDFLRGENNIEGKYGEFVKSASKQASERERVSVNAERAVQEYYKLLYLSNYIGEEFTATVSGVMNFGVFCELDNGIEGLVKADSISGKRLNVDKENYTLSTGKKSYKLGDRVKIKVVGINYGDKRAEFLFV